MKKNIILLMLTVLLSTLLLTGCGDSDSSSTEPDPYNIDDFSFIFSVVSGIDRDNYYVTISNYDETSTISSASLVVNNDEVTLTSEGFMDFYFWTGVLDLQEGDELDCQLTINDISYNVNLVVPSYPTVEWPEVYDPTVAVTIDWTMTADSEYQYFSGYAETFDWETFETIEEDEKTVQLDSSARSYTIAANWLDSGLEDYDFTLEEFSFDTNGKVVAFAVASSYAYYGSDLREDNNVKIQQRMKKIIEEMEEK